jgi:hypothetical protein
MAQTDKASGVIIWAPSRLGLRNCIASSPQQKTPKEVFEFKLDAAVLNQQLQNIREADHAGRPPPIFDWSTTRSNAPCSYLALEAGVVYDLFSNHCYSARILETRR